MRYLLIALLTFISVFPMSKAIKSRHDFKKMWGTLDLRSIGCWLAILFGVIAGYDLWREDSSNKELWNAEMLSNNELRVRLADATNKLQKAYLRIGEQEAVIERQNRSLNAISYSTSTSYAGKVRFLKNFKELARLAKIDYRMTVFEGLVCENGVALFWFDS